MRIIIALISSLMITGCSGSDKATPVSKDLFSLWTSDDGLATLDLTGMSNGVHPITFSFSPNSGCDCSVDIYGDQKNGTANLLSCSPYGPGFYCAGLEDLYDYSNSNGVLTLCGSDGCRTYR